MWEKLLRETEAAKFLTRSVASMRLDRKKQRGPVYFRIGRMIRYRMEDLQAFLEAGRVDHGTRGNQQVNVAQ